MMNRPKLTTILLGVGLFLFFLLLTFPYKNLKGYVFGKIQAATQIQIVADDLYPTFFGWPGVAIRNATVTIPMGASDIELTAEKVVARVGIGGLFPPTPLVSMSISGLKGGGDLYLSFSQSKSSTSVRAESDALELGQIAIPGMSGRISGKVDLDGKFVIDQQDLSRSTGEATLDCKNIKIPPQNLQGIVFPPLPLGPTKAKIAIKNGTAELATFQFGEPTADFRGSATGDLRLGANLMASFLNLTIRIQLTDKFKANPQSATIVSFLESFKTATPGDHAMKWSATLQDMTTNVMAAIPQKAP